MTELRPKWNPRAPAWRRLATAVLAPALVTALALLDERPPTGIVAVLYVLAVVIAARWGGAPAGVAASVLSFLALNFFFTPPLHTFDVGSAQDVVALGVFLVTSVLVGVLFSAALADRTKAERREVQARLINRVATRLLSGEPVDGVLSDFAEGVCSVFGLSKCEIETRITPTISVQRGEVGQPHEVRLKVRGDEIGTIRVWPPGRGSLNNEELIVIESLAAQLALALEALRLSTEVRRAELEAQASGLKADLFSGVTHDVKTPLAAITAAVTSLIDGHGFSDEERRDHLDTIKQEAERLDRVVNNLLDIARLRAGALIASKTLSSIDELIESAVQRLRPLLEEREVTMSVSEDLPEIEMDVVQIDQVITNLIENAIKFTPAQTPISLSAVGHSGGVRVTVSDAGPGVPKEDRQRILEPFERNESGKSGTGLGLAVANAIVKAHAGRLWVSEAPAGGASFTFELPRGGGEPEAVRRVGSSSRS